jgi:hypothetical protein
MRVLRAAAVIALLAGPVYAQQQIPKYGETDTPDKTPQQIEADKAAERAYKNSLGNIPDQTTPSDPWGTMRSGDTSKPAAKATAKSAAMSAAKATPAKPQAKTGSTAN